MDIEGPALFYDGRSSRAAAVRFRLDLARLEIRDTAGALLAEWPVGRLRRAEAGPGQVRIGTDIDDARLEVTDPAVAGTLSSALRAIPGPDSGSWSGIAKVGGWLTAAVVSVALVIWYGVPILADQVAPLIPVSVETEIGQSVKPQIMKSLGRGKPVRVCTAEPGRSHFDRVTAPLVGAAATAVPITIEVIDLATPNAFALPGGSILVTRGLIEKVGSAEEMAAVVAHEIGHVHHRDSMRGVVKAAGLSVVIGVLVGDFTGSSIAVAVGQSLIDAGYSRSTESMADRYAVDLMRRTGRDPAALGTALEAITKGEPRLDGLLAWFSTHPGTEERAKTLRGFAEPSETRRPLLAAGEWQALKAICR